MATAKTKLSTVVEQFKELDLIFKSGTDLDVGERGYGRMLIYGISTQNEVLECESLKSLGDLYLHKAKMKKQKVESFIGACALYKELLRIYKRNDEKEIVQRRIRYAEKCTNLEYNEKGLKLRTKQPVNSTLAVSRTLQELEEKKKMKGHGLMPLIEIYTNLLVKALVERNKLLEIEFLKSLGDLHLDNGRVGKDEAAFTKAAGLYRAALDRCEDSDGRKTLKHRIEYGKEVKKHEAKKAKELMGRRPTAETLVSDNKWLASPSNLTNETSDVISAGNYGGAFKQHLQEGSRALQTGDLDSAERNFAAALKSVHVKGEHWKEVEPLCKLTDVYMARGIHSKDGGDFTKAAALCNAALVRSKAANGDGIKQRIQKLTQSFVNEVLGIKHMVPFDGVQKHKSVLKANRSYVEGAINRIEQQIDPYSLDDDDPRIKTVEKKRVEAIKTLFETIVHQRRTFIAGLVEECMKVIGPPPCKYAMIGLGSQATGLVTPYSDLEFAILIEKETGYNVKYFQNLTHYLHLKVINLGETILPAMAIKSLNNFNSTSMLDNWFYDSVTPRGFAFDGAMPQACKTPLGRGKSCHLIRTPRDMTKVLEDDVTLHLRKGYHLATVLGSVSLIIGEQHLVDEYTDAWDQQLQGSRRNIAKLIADTMLKENIHTFVKEDLTDRMLDVKKNIYRFSSLAVSCWALLCDIQPTTIWATIQKMHKKGAINDENANHLMVLVSISAELRLRTYMNNRGQVENMSALSTMSTDSDIMETSKKVFYFSNTKQLMRYYYTATPLKNFFSRLTNSESFVEPVSLFDSSFKLQAEVYKSLCDNRKWKTYTERALQEEKSTHGKNAVHPDIADLLNKLGQAWKNLGDHRKAIKCYKEALQMARTMYGTVHPDIDASLNNLGNAWTDLGVHDKAVRHYEQALQMERSMYGESTAHPDIATSLINLGSAWSELGGYKKAYNYYEQALKMTRTIYGENKAHPDIAAALNNLGNVWQNLGDNRKAISYHQQSLQMSRSIYGETTAHSEIASSLNNLGNVLRDLGDFRDAVSYYEQALMMKKSVYGDSTSHPLIADSLHSIGNTWIDLGDYGKALNYYEQSLQMRRSIYGETTAHPDIAKSLNNLGATWSYLGDHRKAVSYYESSLQMNLSIYGRNAAHPEIATSFNNLGTLWQILGDNRKAVDYYERSLKMMRIVYGEKTAHHVIAGSLNNLGKVWSELGDHQKAVNYHEESLKLFRRIHCDRTAHPDISMALTNLGKAWSHLGDHRKAVGYHEQSLQMLQSIYGENTAHHDIALSLYNLGDAWDKLGDDRKAFRYFEEYRRMKQKS